jgi:hypothetical protein
MAVSAPVHALAKAGEIITVGKVLCYGGFS